MNAARRIVLAGFAACALLAPSLARAAEPAAAPLAPPPLQFPTPVVRTLSSGLRVEVLPSSRTPLVQVQLLVPAGSAQEPDTLVGLASLTAELLRHGTSSRTTEAFNADLARVGATFTTWAGRDFALASGTVRPGALEPLLELMSDAVANPLFAGEQYPSDLEAWIRRINVQRQNLADYTDQRLLDAAFAPHPYAHTLAGSATSLGEIGQNDTREFHRDYWRPDRAVLTVAGDVSPEKVFALVEDRFGSWQGRALADRPRPTPAPRAGVRIVDMPRAPRAEIRVAVPGPGQAHPTWASWALAEAALESASLPSGVRVSIVPSRDASLIVLSSATPVAEAAAQAGRMKEVLRSFAATPPSGAALDAVRRRVRQRYPLGLETLGSLISTWQANEFAGWSADELAKGGERIAAADLAPALARLAAPPIVQVVGPASVMSAAFAALGPVEVVPQDIARATKPNTLGAPTADQLKRGAAAVAAAVAAHGGAAAIAGAKTLVFEGDVTVMREGQSIPAQFSNVHIDPDRFSGANKVFNLESRQVMIGDHGWTIMSADSVTAAPLDSVGLLSVRAVFLSDVVHMLRAAAAPGARAALRGREVVGTRNCDLVDFEGPLGRVRLVIDAVTHRVLAIDTGLAGDLNWHSRRLLSDFRTVNGLLLPFTEDRFVDGQKDAHTLVRSAAVNKSIDMHLFNPPQALYR